MYHCTWQQTREEKLEKFWDQCLTCINFRCSSKINQSFGIFVHYQDLKLNLTQFCDVYLFSGVLKNTCHKLYHIWKNHCSSCIFVYTLITAQKVKFSIKDFFSKCNQIRIFLRIWSNLLKKCLIEKKTSFFCRMDIVESIKVLPSWKNYYNFRGMSIRWVDKLFLYIQFLNVVKAIACLGKGMCKIVVIVILHIVSLKRAASFTFVMIQYG